MTAYRTPSYSLELTQFTIRTAVPLRTTLDSLLCFSQNTSLAVETKANAYMSNTWGGQADGQLDSQRKKHWKTIDGFRKTSTAYLKV